MDPSLLISGGMAASSLLGSIGSSFLSSSTSKSAQWRAYNYARALQQQQYDLQQKGYLEGPTNARQGMVNAGYNPILGLTQGSGFSGAVSGGSPVNANSPDIADLGASIKDAYQTFQLNKQSVANQTAQTESNVQLNNAEIAYKDELAQSEQIKRAGYELDNSIKYWQGEQEKFKVGTQEYRFAREMEEAASRTKLNLETAKFTGYNALSNRISANAQQTNAQINEDINAGNIANAKELEQWYKDHPYQAKLLRGIERYGKATSTFFGAGTSLGNAYMYTNAMKYGADAHYMGGNFDVTQQSFDKHGKLRGHTRTSYRKH